MVKLKNRLSISRKNVKSTGSLHSIGKVRESINDILAVSGSMTAKDFSDMIFLKQQSDKVTNSDYQYPEVFKGDSAPMMSNAESDESVRQSWIRKHDLKQKKIDHMHQPFVSGSVQ